MSGGHEEEYESVMETKFVHLWRQLMTVSPSTGPVDMKGVEKCRLQEEEDREEDLRPVKDSMKVKNTAMDCIAFEYSPFWDLLPQFALTISSALSKYKDYKMRYSYVEFSLKQINKSYLRLLNGIMPKITSISSNDDYCLQKFFF